MRDTEGEVRNGIFYRFMNGEGKISCMKDTKYQRSVKGCMHLYCSVHSYLRSMKCT
jgi:hypothetical protein